MLINGQLLTAAQPVKEWQPITLTCNPHGQGDTVRLRIGTEDLGAPTLKLGDARWRWTWNPENRTGSFPVVLTVGADSETWSLTVVPSKLRLEQYERLLQEVQATALALMLALGGGKVGSEGGPRVTERSLLLTWPQLEQQVMHAVDLAKAIARSPQELPKRTITSRPLYELDTIDGAALANLASQPLDEVGAATLPTLQTMLQPLGHTGVGSLPHSITVSSTASSHDCLEHRLLRGVIDRLAQRVTESGAIMQREQERRTRSGLGAGLIRELQLGQQRAARELRRAQALPLLDGLPAATHCITPTHLMRHDRRYRALYALWRSLREMPQLAIDSPLWSLPLADLPTLYEQWCLLWTAASLLEFGEVEQQSLFRIGAAHGLTWTLTLAENCPLLVLRQPNGGRAKLYYQRRYLPLAGHHEGWGSLDPFLRIPDIVIELEQEGHRPMSLLLDAKYRVMPDGSLPQNALDTAYTYRGAVGYNGLPATSGVWLLFPGTTPVLAGDVGALPTLPDHTNALQAILERVMRTDAATT